MKNSTAYKMDFEKAYYDNVIMFPGTEYMLEKDHGFDIDSVYDDVEADYEIDYNFSIEDVGIMIDNILMSKLSDIPAFAGCAACFVYIMYRVFDWLMYV